MRDDPNVGLKRQIYGNKTQKGCQFMKTAGRWPWKSESAKECVTTHLPNGLAPKMDGVHRGAYIRPLGPVSAQRVGGRSARVEVSV
jgi:hypothetical protein